MYSHYLGYLPREISIIYANINARSPARLDKVYRRTSSRYFGADDNIELNEKNTSPAKRNALVSSILQEGDTQLRTREFVV